MVEVDTASFLAIGATAALAATLVTFGGRWIFVPVVVLELLLGILIGPDILGIAEPDQFIIFFSGSACCSSSPATRSTSSGSAARR